jgi:hypothetical protein
MDNFFYDPDTSTTQLVIAHIEGVLRSVNSKLEKSCDVNSLDCNDPQTILRHGNLTSVLIKFVFATKARPLHAIPPKAQLDPQRVVRLE